jgi:excisionase family DNA binding protein
MRNIKTLKRVAIQTEPASPRSAAREKRRQALPVQTVDVLGAAAMFTVGKTMLWQAIADKRLPCFRIGRRVLLRPDDVMSWIEKESAK